MDYGKRSFETMRLYLPFILAFLVFAAVITAQYAIAGSILDRSLRSQSQRYHAVTSAINLFAAEADLSGDSLNPLKEAAIEAIAAQIGAIHFDIRISESREELQEHIAFWSALEIPAENDGYFGKILGISTYEMQSGGWLLVNAYNYNEPIIKNLRDVRFGLIIILIVMVIFAIVPGALVIESLNRRWRLTGSLARVSARETELALLEALEATDRIPCLVVGISGIIMYANKSCRRLLEIEGRPEGRPVSSITSLPDPIRRGELLTAGSDDGGAVTITSMTGMKTRVNMGVYHRRKNGEVISCICVFAGGAFDAGKEGKTCENDSDKAVQPSGSILSGLAGTIIHQMNNHLSGILGTALMEREKGGGDSILKISEAAITLTDLFSQLRTILSGDEEADHKKPLDELNLIADLMRRILPQGVEFRVSGGSRMTIAVGRSFLRELVYNLALNSTSLMNGRGRIRVEVSDRLPDSGGALVPLPPDKWVCIRYSDGYIMPVALRDVLSSMNYSLPDVERMFGSTTGSIYRILRQLDVKVLFERGAGETVLCLLIEGFDPGRSRAHVISDVSEEAGQVSGLSVLVADDIDIVLESICEYLEHSGMTVTRASDGDAAMELLAESSFDAAVLDMNMPGESTESIVRYCRTRYPDMALIICTGYGMTPVIRELIKAPSTQCVHKPHRPEALVEAIYSTLLILREQD